MGGVARPGTRSRVAVDEPADRELLKSRGMDRMVVPVPVATRPASPNGDRQSAVRRVPW